MWMSEPGTKVPLKRDCAVHRDFAGLNIPAILYRISFLIVIQFLKLTEVFDQRCFVQTGIVTGVPDRSIGFSCASFVNTGRVIEKLY